ncbi:Serine/threonine-protein kinase ATM [Gryllus bimaculatus]|nr:Serine/threonine-protein kinase ATM [Gryllus bimaculatus]
MEGTSSKRRKLDVGITSLVARLQISNDTQTNPWFVLLLIGTLISKYPSSLKEEEFALVLEHIAEIQSSCKKDLLIEQNISLCCITLLENEKLYKKLNKTTVNVLWDKIWVTTMRSVGRAQSEKASHSLLQALMLHDKAKNLPEVVNLFFDNTFQVCLPTVQTLHVLLGKYDLSALSPTGAVSSSGHSTIRNTFLQWLLPESSSENSTMIIPSLVEVLIQLCSKTIRPSKPSGGLLADKRNLEIMLQKMENDYMISSFVPEGIKKDLACSSTTPNDISIDTLIWDCIHELLVRKCNILRNSLSANCFSISNLKNIFYHLSLLLEVWRVFDGNIPDSSMFLETIDFFMQYVYRHLAKQLNNAGNCPSEIVRIFHEFQSVLLAKYSRHISQWLCDSWLKKLVESTVSFVTQENSFCLENDILGMEEFSNRNDKNEDTTSVLDECFKLEHEYIPQFCTKDVSEDQKLHMECLKFLGCFCSLGNGHFNEVNDIAIQLLNHVPLNGLHRFNGIVWIVWCLQNNEKMDTLVISKVIIQLKYLFTTWFNDSETTFVILRLLQGIVKHVHSNGTQEEKDNFRTLLLGILKCIAKNKFGVKVTVGFIKCLEALSTVDPSASWSRNEEGPMVEKILDFLDSSSHEIRLSSIKSLRITMSESVGRMDDSWHLKIFSNICKKIDESFIIEGELGTCSVIDEAANRSACALHAFVGVLIGNPTLYKQALFRLLKFCKQKNLDVELFKRAITYFCSVNDINSFAFLKRNLPFLVSEWLENKFPLQDLAKYLFQMPLPTFCLNYVDVLVPIILLRDDMMALQDISGFINQNLKEMFQDSFPQIMGELVPGLEADDVLAIECHKKLENVISRDGMETLLNSQLPKLIVAVFRKVHDPAHFMDLTRTRLKISQPDRSSISFDTAINCIKYLQRGSPSPETNLLEFLCQNSPNHIQMILLDLTIDIYEAILLQDKLVSFYHYAVFTSAVVSDMRRKTLPVISHILCCIVHTLTHIIKEATVLEVNLAITACHFLEYICELCLPQNANILSKLLILMTDTLVPTVKIGGEVGTAAMKLLKFIFMDKRQYFSEADLLIDILPSDPEFQEIKNITQIKNQMHTSSLKEEITRFLQMRYLSGKQGVESLKHLHQLLSTKKRELKSMYDQFLGCRGFSEDCGKSLMHCLVCRLVELVASSEFEVSVHAGHCLGEIGPSDLGSLVLRPDAGQQVTSCADVVPLVAECLLDENIKVVRAASQAMYSLIRFKDCNTFAENQVNLSCGISCTDFLHPFNAGKKTKTLSFEIDESLSKAEISNENLWYPKDDSDHESWVIKLTTTTLRYLSKGNNFLPTLIPLCEVKAEFSEKILPLFVSKLSTMSAEFNKIILHCIKQFFERHVRLHLLQNSESSNNVCLNKASVQCMLNLVHFLRVHDNLKDNWNPTQLDLNYLSIAQAAQFCNAYFSSILYVELWSDKWLRTENSEEIYGQSQTVLERICEMNPDDGSNAQKILWEAYMRICDTDAIYGCGSSLLLDPNKRPLHYELRGEWDKVILSHDIRLSSGHTESSRGLIYALQKAGLEHVLDVYLRSVTNAQCSEDLQYECAWRLSKWDTQLVNPLRHQGNFEQWHFLALRALSDNDKVGFAEALKEAHKSVSNSLVNLSLESCKSIYKPLSQFQLIQEMSEFHSVENELELDDLLKKWLQRDEIVCNQFEDIEPVFRQRIVMLNSSRDKNLNQKAAEVAVRLATLAREENQLQVAAKCVGLFNVTNLPSNLNALLKMEEAQLAWSSGDLALGKRIMRNLIVTFDQQNLKTLLPVMYAQALKLSGDWMVETKSENPQVVIDRHYLTALKILNDIGDSRSDNVLDVYSALARFADGQYQNLSNYFKSRAYEVKKQWIEKAAQDIEDLKKLPNRTKDDDRTIVLKQRQSKIDNEELYTTRQQKDKYLADAVKYYLQCLAYGDRNNLDVFRVASIWLENMLHSSLKVILDDYLCNVPSYKFVPILPQLTPRMSNVKDDFTIKLNKLLMRCAEEHPHHTLPIILALANSYKDQDYTQGASTSDKRKAEPRVLGAQKLVQDLSKHNNVGGLLQRMNEVYLALISIAYMDPKTGKGNDRVIPEKAALLKLKKVDTVLVPTLTIPVEMSCKYTGIIGIVKYEPSYSLVGGINAPKKLTCLGTDGVRRLQLIKGKDDLRQDAVMQQVFTIMNTFLRKSKDTSKRKLLIRTYKVLPLSQRSGIIEWCENTIPILMYLTGSDHRSGAHRKYYPNDKPSMQCRETMRTVCTKSAEKRLEAYKEICCSIHPAFRYFFLEHFTSPGSWFERRLAYIHSVATSSMIGYILGLGDRHLMNILIDKSTAEVIHIDFGIAFEMGHVLPTPETVPFRLTRDIVDGMGVSGTEGVFQKSCEKTMFVLREHQTILLTVLEVLLYDPLYAWTITPSKAYKLQKKDVKIMDDSDSVEVNRMAERALQRLQQKLLGTEMGAGVSIPTQRSKPTKIGLSWLQLSVPSKGPFPMVTDEEDLGGRLVHEETVLSVPEKAICLVEKTLSKSCWFGSSEVAAPPPNLPCVHSIHSQGDFNEDTMCLDEDILARLNTSV